MIRIPIIYAIIANLVLLVSASQADEPTQTIKEFLAPDVIAVTYVDLNEIDLPASLSGVQQFVTLTPAEKKATEAVAKYLQETIKQLQSIGVTHVCHFLRNTELQTLNPTIVFCCSTADQADAAAESIKDLLNQIVGRNANSMVAKSAGKYVFVSQTGAAIAQATQPIDADVLDGLKAIKGASAGVLLFGDDDTRCVIRELMTNAPPPFEKVTGQKIADDLKWLGVQLNVASPLTFTLQLQTSDESTAQEFSAITENALPATLKMATSGLIDDEQLVNVLASQLQPQVTGNRIKISYDATQNPELAKVVGPTIERARDAARATASQNNLRQLALAIHNYLSAYKKFPNPLAKTADGQPGLSWRVQILPFLEQSELYKQFKHDEPWNSEHNLKLAERMPAVFKSPVRPGVDSNMTVYQVPVSSAALFQPTDAKGISFKDITDGSSNTIMIIEVAEKDAVVWTKPDDWEVDDDNPWPGLGKEKYKQIGFARADGSTGLLPLDLEPKDLKALTTRAGGEVVEF